jgi:proton-dependent oligopeptide transporter, POT family
MSKNDTNDFFKDQVLGHPAGLFIVFFTEMWERFSFYGMRSLLVLFFMAPLAKGGWAWEQGTASSLFGTYVGLVYLSTMLGGYFADKIIGFRWAVVLGAFLMAMGHFSMAFESTFSIYLGLTLLIFGNGFFKPNMTSIISEMYKHFPEKKDGAYTIFYMGVNSGAFFGILLCGYLGEKVGWTYGFGLAGIFMLLGLLQFWFAQAIFGDIGLKPVKKEEILDINDTDKRVPFTMWQLVLIGLSALLGMMWLINVPATKITKGAFNMFDFQLFGYAGNTVAIISALLIFLVLVGYRLTQYSQTTREKLIAVLFFAIISAVFWSVFEQSPNSLTVFAKKYTNRVLTGNSSLIFLIFNSFLTIIPLVITNWVMYRLFKNTFKKYPLANILLSLSYLVVWIIALWMLAKDYYTAGFLSLSDGTLDFLKIDKVTVPLTEIPATWFSTFNSLFVISLAPLFAKVWESKYNPTANSWA